MAGNSISNVSLKLQSLRLIGVGQDKMATLQQQLATKLKTSDLSELGATGSRRLLDLRGQEDSTNSYTQVINILQPRVKTQSQVLTSVYDIMSQVKSAINKSGNIDAATKAGLPQQISDALRQVTAYLNENIDGRYLFSGSRFSTKPVTDLTTLPVPPTEPYPFTPATLSTSPSLPSYDTQYKGSNIVDETTVGSVSANGGTNSFTLGTGNWADLGYQVGDTVTFSGLSAAGNNATYTIAGISGGLAVMTGTPAVTTMAADTTVTLTRAPGASSTDALSRNGDTVNISDGLPVTYGISSNDPGFQNLIMGLRWANAAMQDPSNYTTYMDRATTLFGTADNQIRGLQAANTANESLLGKTKDNYKILLNSILGSQDDIQGVDTNEVAAKITLLQTQVEASYSATAILAKLSLVNYL